MRPAKTEGDKKLTQGEKRRDALIRPMFDHFKIFQIQKKFEYFFRMFFFRNFPVFFGKKLW